jgi:hypothetical protein
MAQPPPVPKPCQNMMRTWAASAKIYQRIAGVSARRFEAMAKKIYKYSLKKHTFSPRARRSTA